MSDAAAKEWERLYNEANRKYREAAERLDSIVYLVADHGCDCDCGHHHDEHDGDCDRCLACRISYAVTRK